MAAKIIGLPQRTYSAQAFYTHVSGLDVAIAGTLDGVIDMALTHPGGSLTYRLTPDDARVLAAHLLSAADDVQRNCLYDRDALLARD